MVYFLKFVGKSLQKVSKLTARERLHNLYFLEIILLELSQQFKFIEIYQFY